MTDQRIAKCTDEIISGLSVSIPAEGIRDRMERLAILCIRAWLRFEPSAAAKALPDVHWGYRCHVCGGPKDGYEALQHQALREINGL